MSGQHQTPPPHPLTRRSRAATWRLLAALSLLTGCGAGPVAPAVTPWSASALHHVYLRGAPSAEAGRGRVAITLNGPDRCTGPTLAALGQIAEAGAPLPVSFFWSPERVRVLRGAQIPVAEADGAKDEGQAAMPRWMQVIQAGGYGLYLLAEPIFARWQQDPGALRAGLVEARGTLTALHAEGEAIVSTRGWRPPADGVSPALMQQAGELGQPVLMWSLHLDKGSPEALVEALMARVGDGDIVALDVAPGADGACAVAEALPRMAEALKAASLTPVSLETLLGSEWRRFEPLRLVKYQGAGISADCAEALAEGGDELGAGTYEGLTEGPRWALVDRSLPDRGAVVLPLPGPGGEPASVVLGDKLAGIRALWRRRARWRALPACLKVVAESEIVSPVSGGRWWWVGPEGTEAVKPRMLTGPSRPLVLPARDDLLRVEALTGSSRRLRGVVSEALEGLGLQAPMLVESRAAVAAVLGGPKAEVVGYVPVAEFTLGEYRFLAALSPGEAEGLNRAAHGAEGFFRAGPWITLPDEPGGWPRLHGLRLNGAQAFAQRPGRMRAQILALGQPLAPGDVLVPHPDPDVYAGLSPPVDGARLSRSALRRKLQRLLQIAFKHGRYLRPGHTLRVDGDVLGSQSVRVALAPGVAPLLGGAEPLIAPVVEGEGGEAEAEGSGDR